MRPTPNIPPPNPGLEASATKDPAVNRDVLDDLEAILAADRGPDMKQVTALLDGFLCRIADPGDVARVAESAFGAAESPVAALAHGMFWVRVGHWVRARQILGALTEREGELPEQIEAFAWISLAECEYKLRQYEAIQGPLHRARHLAEKRGLAQLKALSLLLTARVAFKQYALDEVHLRIEEAGRVLRPEFAWSIPAILADIQGQIEVYHGRSDFAQDAFHAAEHLARAADDSRALALVLRDTIRLHLLTENRERAEDTIAQAREVARKAHDWLGEAALLAMEGDLFHSAKEYDAAERQYRESSRINESLAYRPGRTICSISLARTALAQRRRDDAHQHLETAMQLLDATGTARHRADALLVHAILGEAEGADDTASRYRDLKASFATCPHGYRYARSLFHYGCYLAKKGKVEEAAQLLAEAYEKATPLQAPMLGRIRDLMTMPGKQWSDLWSGLYRRLQARSSQLEATKTTLERITRQRRGATAMLVHDLKNQLASLLASLSTAKNLGVPLPLGDRDYIPLLLAYARSVTGRVECLTEYWKADLEGELKPDLAEVDFGEILDGVRTAGELLEVNDIRWTLNAPDSIPKITCDAQQIQRVFENLIFNARTYAQAVHTETRYVTVDVLWDDFNAELRMSVANGGPTIPEEKIEEIFERFVRVSYEDRDEIKQSLFNRAHVGLGLFYCRQVLTAHGGRIWAENLDDDSGVKFTFVLPQQPPVTG